MKNKTVAFIPARSGSKRVPNKNIKILDGHPLMAYSIVAARESGIFDSVICLTDSVEYASIAKYYGAEVPFLRPLNISTDDSPDNEWLSWILLELNNMGKFYDIFSILRPTSPFRLPETILRAYECFCSSPKSSSLRAIEKCKQHPGKMWILRGNNIFPLIPFSNTGTPWHNSPYGTLPEIYVQNASLEIAWVKNILEYNDISGSSIIPFFTEGLEGFDINDEEDWIMAKHYIENFNYELPKIGLAPYKF